MNDLKNKKSLVIYFSHNGENYMADGIRNIDKGNTEIIAEYIKDIIGADLFKVESEKEYSYNYRECCNVARDELKNGARPKLKEELKSVDNYDVIYIGYPIWYGTMPMPLFTQLEKLDFNGKIIRPFATHEGSGIANSQRDIKNICKGAIVLDGIAIRGSNVYNAKEEIENWL